MMKRSVCGLLVGVASVAFSQSLTVGEFDYETVHVPEGEVLASSSRVWFEKGGRLDKTGAGEWEIPLEALTRNGEVDVGVRNGTLTLTGVSVPDPVQPLALMQTAALWLDASQNVKTESGSYVDWCDVRETAAALPYVYRHVIPLWLDPSEDGSSGVKSLPVLRTDEDELPSIYCRGYKSGAFLRIAAANQASELSTVNNIQHVFAVHAVRETQGFLISNESGRRCYHPGTTQGRISDTILTPNGDNLLYLNNMAVYLNGRRVDPNVAVPERGRQVLELNYCNYYTQTIPDDYRNSVYCGSFFNDSSIRPATSSETFSHIGGDDLHEVLFFTNLLTRAQCAAITDWLMWKWQIARQPEKGCLRVAEGATVNVSDPNALTLQGRGTVVPVGEAPAVFQPAQPDFEGTVAVPPSGAHFRDDVFAVRVCAGQSLTATNAPGGKWVQTAPADPSAVRVAATDTALTVRKWPQEATALTLESGVLRLTAPWTGQAPALAPGDDPEVPNGGFEFAGADGKGYSDRFGAWMWTPGTFNGTWCTTWSKSLYSVYYPDGNVTWFSDYQAPEGDYVAALYGDTTLSVEVTIPAAGEYVLSFRANDPRRTRGVGYRKQCVAVSIGEKLLGRLVAPRELGYARYRYETGFLPAGTVRLSFKGLVPDTKDVLMTLDDVRLTRKSRPQDGYAIPNGDFEQFAVPDASSVFYLSTANTADGWTLTQGNWGSSAAADPAVTLVRFGMRFTNTDTAYPAKRQDWRTGHTQLAMMGASGEAETTFIPPAAGTYYLQAAVSRLRATVNGVNFRTSSSDPILWATLTSGSTVTSLGAVTGACQRLTDLKWPQTFTFPDAQPVTLTLSNGNAAAAAILDDVRLVDAEEDWKRQNLVQNGVCDSDQRGWTLWSWKDEAVWDQARSLAGYQTANDNYGWDVLEDGGVKRSSLMLVDYAGAYQDIDVPRPGRYRLRYHTRGRDDAAAAVLYYSRRNEGRVKWIDGAVTNLLSTTGTLGTNFTAQTVYLDVPEAGSYRLAFETSAFDVTPGERGFRSQHVFFDGISLCYDGPIAPRASFDLPETLSVTVAEGARLVLDYAGTNLVDRVSLGGHSVVGVIDAVSHPHYVTGPGALQVIGKGTILVLR